MFAPTIFLLERKKCNLYCETIKKYVIANHRDVILFRNLIHEINYLFKFIFHYKTNIFQNNVLTIFWKTQKNVCSLKKNVAMYL